MNSSAVQPCSANAGAHRRLDPLDRERLAVEPEHAVAVLRLRSSEATPVPSPPRRRAARAGSPRARRRPSRAGASSNRSLVDGELDPRLRGAGRRCRAGNVLRHDRALDPGVRARARDPLEAHLEQVEALRVELVDPDLLERVHGDAGAEPADAVGLHRADVDVPGAVALEVEERVGNAERDLVAELRASGTCRR